jgi:hypothetical protein
MARERAVSHGIVGAGRLVTGRAGRELDERDVSSLAPRPAARADRPELGERPLAAVAPADHRLTGHEGDAAHRRVDLMAGRAAHGLVGQQRCVGSSLRALLAMAAEAGVGGIVLVGRGAGAGVGVTAAAIEAGDPMRSRDRATARADRCAATKVERQRSEQPERAGQAADQPTAGARDIGAALDLRRAASSAADALRQPDERAGVCSRLFTT